VINETCLLSKLERWSKFIVFKSIAKHFR